MHVPRLNLRHGCAGAEGCHTARSSSSPIFRARGFAPTLAEEVSAPGGLCASGPTSSCASSVGQALRQCSVRLAPSPLRQRMSLPVAPQHAPPAAGSKMPQAHAMLPPQGMLPSQRCSSSRHWAPSDSVGLMTRLPGPPTHGIPAHGRAPDPASWMPPHLQSNCAQGCEHVFAANPQALQRLRSAPSQSLICAAGDISPRMVPQRAQTAVVRLQSQPPPQSSPQPPSQLPSQLSLLMQEQSEWRTQQSACRPLSPRRLLTSSQHPSRTFVGRADPDAQLQTPPTPLLSPRDVVLQHREWETTSGSLAPETASGALVSGRHLPPPPPITLGALSLSASVSVSASASASALALVSSPSQPAEAVPPLTLEVDAEEPFSGISFSGDGYSCSTPSAVAAAPEAATGGAFCGACGTSCGACGGCAQSPWSVASSSILAPNTSAVLVPRSVTGTPAGCEAAPSLPAPSLAAAAQAGSECSVWAALPPAQRERPRPPPLTSPDIFSSPSGGGGFPTPLGWAAPAPTSTVAAVAKAVAPPSGFQVLLRLCFGAWSTLPRPSSGLAAIAQGGSGAGAPLGRPPSSRRSSAGGGRRHGGRGSTEATEREAAELFAALDSVSECTGASLASPVSLCSACDSPRAASSQGSGNLRRPGCDGGGDREPGTSEIATPTSVSHSSVGQGPSSFCRRGPLEGLLATGRKLPAMFSALAVCEDGAPPSEDGRGLLRLEFRVAPCWRSELAAVGWSPSAGAGAAAVGSFSRAAAAEKDVREEEASLQLSPMTLSLGGSSPRRSLESTAPSSLSSLPSPLWAAGSLGGGGKGRHRRRPASAPLAPGAEGFSPGALGLGGSCGQAASAAPLVNVLRQRAEVLSRRLLRRERQCAALREALDRCAGSGGVSCSGREAQESRAIHVALASTTIFAATPVSAIAGESKAHDGCTDSKQAQLHGVQWRAPLTSCENLR
mmetsp:Transcript_3602/g.8486  ORF Transcript_3602/g.8486 Transcript_3602/m.8486 type:complete len:954 (-) Transcript_3602:42-2903(-)